MTNLPAPDITLGKAASSPTYNVAGQVITYTYTITNSGNTVLGPSQFTIADDKINGGVAFNCGAATTTLAIDASVTCTAHVHHHPGGSGLRHVTNEATASVTIAGGPTLTSTITVTINARPEPAPRSREARGSSDVQRAPVTPSTTPTPSPTTAT